MSEIRTQIIAAILKAKEFRAYEIVEEVGCSRQLVNHHLQKFTESGYLDKHDRVYTVADADGLIEALTTGVNNRNLAQTPFLTNINLWGLKNTVTYAQVLMVPKNIEIRKQILMEIDNSLRSLKNLRYSVINNQVDKNTIRKSLRDGSSFEEYVNAYMKYAQMFGIKVTRDEVEFQLVDALKEED